MRSPSKRRRPSRILALLAALLVGMFVLSGCFSSSSSSNGNDGNGGNEDPIADNGNGGDDDTTVENHWNVMNWNEGEWE